MGAVCRKLRRSGGQSHSNRWSSAWSPPRRRAWQNPSPEPTRMDQTPSSALRRWGLPGHRFLAAPQRNEISPLDP